MPEQPCAFHPDRRTVVTCSRCGRPICPDDMIDAPVGIHCPVCAGRMREGALGEASYRARTTVERSRVGRRLTAASVTRVLIGLNVVAAVVTMLPRAAVGFEPQGWDWVLLNPLHPSQWWRLVTSMFIHVGLLHLLFNMYALNMFGPPIEQRYGKVRFILLYLLSGLAGGAATLALSDIGASAGASGAVFGLFGAWFAFFLRHRTMPGAREQINSLLVLLGINLAFGLLARGINNFAHGGGLAAGFAIALLFELSGRARGRTWIEAAGLAVVAVVVGVGIRAGMISFAPAF